MFTIHDRKYAAAITESRRALDSARRGVDGVRSARHAKRVMRRARRRAERRALDRLLETIATDDGR